MDSDSIEQEMADIDSVPEMPDEEHQAMLDTLVGQFVEKAFFHKETGMTFINFSNGQGVAIGELWWKEQEETKVVPN